MCVYVDHVAVAPVKVCVNECTCVRMCEPCVHSGQAESHFYIFGEYMYVCMYVCLSVRMYFYMYVYMCKQKEPSVYTYVCMCVCMYDTKSSGRIT
jgi:hypothetical protein